MSELDHRTLALLDALHRPGASLLHALLTAGDATEHELLARIERIGTSQPTVNRTLGLLDQLGLIERRNPGRSHTPNRQWSIRHRDEARDLLLSAIDLSELTAKKEVEIRRKARAALSG